MVKPRRRGRRAGRRVGPVSVYVAGAGDPDDDLRGRALRVDRAEAADQRRRDRPVGRQLRPAGGRGAGRPVSDQVLARAAGQHLLAALPVDVGDGRAGEQLEVVHGRREAGPEATARRVPDAEQVLAALVVDDLEVERLEEADRAHHEGGIVLAGPTSGAERRVAERRDQRRVSRVGGAAEVG